MRKTIGLVCLAAVLAVVQPASALDWIVSSAAVRSLEHGNGNKIAYGRFNSLHVVYEEGALVKYVSSQDGDTWTAPVVLNSAANPGAYPSIAVDGSGTVVVVYASNFGTNGLGQIRYARKPAASTTWTTTQIVQQGTEPVIAASGSTVHVAWTTRSAIHYTSFATTSPPAAPLAMGEELEATSCAGTGFVKPSITLVRKPCAAPVPKVGYLFYSDERTSSNTACQSLETKVGPHVCERDNTTATWSLIFDGVRTALNPAGGVDPINLSLNSHFSRGDVYLAWSDEQDGNQRTRIAHGNGASWTDTVFDGDRRHVHIAANRLSGATAGQFRFAWSGNGSWDEFFSPDTWARKGKYNLSTALTWIDPTPTLITDGGIAGRPQAVFWSRCSQGSYSTISFIAETEGVCSSSRISSDFSTVAGCPPITWDPVLADPCHHAAVAVARLPLVHGGIGVAIDTAEVGTVTEVREDGATILTPERATVRVSWPAGEVIQAWDEGLVVVTDPRAVRFESEDRLEVVDLGYLVEYEPERLQREEAAADDDKCTPDSAKLRSSTAKRRR